MADSKPVPPNMVSGKKEPGLGGTARGTRTQLEKLAAMERAETAARKAAAAKAAAGN